MLFTIVGDDPTQRTPDALVHPVMPKPDTTAPFGSLAIKLTAGLPPSAARIVVTSGPSKLLKTTLLPLNATFSVYVPGATNTVSPSTAMLIPACIVSWSAGTWMVAA